MVNRRKSWFWGAVLLLAVLLLAWFLVFSPMSPFKSLLQSSRQRQGEVLAKLSYILRTVEARQAGKIDWNSAKTMQDLYEDDAVKTAGDSAALIRYGEEDTIRLEENSLIIIQKLKRDASGQSEVSLEILSGGIVGSAGKMTLNIKTPQGVARLEPSGPDKAPSRAVVSVAESQAATVSVINGSVQLENRGKSIELKQGQGVRVEAPAVAPSPAPGAAPETAVAPAPEAVPLQLPPIPQLLEPADGAVFTSGANVTLRFAATASDAQQLRYHVQVGSDAQFKTLVTSKYLEAPLLELTALPIGIYYWNVAAVDASRLHGPFSQTYKFSVEAVAAAPTPTAVPFTPTIYRITAANAAAAPLKSGAEVAAGAQLTTGPGALVELGAATQSILKLRPESQLKVDIVEQGPDSWRSQTTLERGAVVIVLRADGKPAPQQSVKVGEARFNFSPENLGAAKYGELLLEKLPPDSYRLTLLRGEYRSTPVATAPVKELPMPQQAIPVDHVKNTAVYLHGEIPLLLLRPSAATPAGAVTFEVGRDAKFAKALFRERGERAAMPLLADQPGNYYWRYQRGEAAASSVAALTLTERPQGVQPTSGVLQIDDTKQELQLPYSGVTPQTHWSWRRSVQAVAYQLEISGEAQMRKPIFLSENLRQNKLDVLIDALEPGDFFWRVRELDYRGKVIAMSPIRRLQLVHAKSGPKLQLNEPPGDGEVASASLKVSGTVLGGGKLWINDTAVAIGKDGKFSTTVVLAPGHQLLVVRLVDPNGSVTIDYRKVYLKN